MKIAILGWGSLIWQPKELAFDKDYGWKENGPILPIEFARISKDSRLTLVITSNGTKVPVLYTLSKYDNLDEAILNLAIREGSGKKSIGKYNITDNSFSPNFLFEEEIKNWIDSTEFDAVIWTNLNEKWEIKNEDGIVSCINPEKRIDYLIELKGHQRALAEEYIRKTPSQIKTDFRKIVEQELNWFPIIDNTY